MVAADVLYETTTDDTFNRGDIVETSRGTGIVVDSCELAVEKRKNTGEIHLDIATIWNEHPELSKVDSQPVKVEVGNTNINTNSTANILEDAENKKQDELNEIFGIEPEEDTKTETQKPNYDIGGYTPKDPEPEYVEIPIEEGTPEAILQAASKFDEVTSDSEYVCSVLNEAGYLSYEGVNQFKDYSITELCKQFEKFGWERITDTANLQVGDIIIINNGEGECMRIYAGNNKWYVAGAEEVQQGDINWAENSTWYAYRPSIDETGPTMKV